MPLNYTYIPEQDFSKGIDVHSAEASVQPGFVEDALNVDIAEKRLIKRPGYQAQSGHIPLRVEKLTYDNTLQEIRFQLSDAFDLSVINDTPIVVYGRTSITGSGGDFSSTDTGQYYASISTDPRKTLTGATTTIDDHGFLDDDFVVYVTESTDPNKYDNQTIGMDEIEIDQSSYDVTLSHTLTSVVPSFVYYYDTTADPGQIYKVQDNNGGGGWATGTHNITITSGTHALDNFNIHAIIEEDVGPGSTWKQIELDSVIIRANGNVELMWTNDGPTISNIRITLISCPAANFKSGSFAASTSAQTLVVSNQDDPFILGSLYLEDVGTGDLTLIKPDLIEYDQDTTSYTITVTVGVSANFQFFYDFGFTQTNVIKVTPITPITLDAVDDTPQLTVWGVRHSVDGVYGPNKIAREGWVTHLDSYKSAGEQRLVAGLGGNLFSSRTRAELSEDYKLPSLLTRLRNRVSTDVTVGPLFRGTGTSAVPDRSRGYINCANGTSNFVTIDSINYQDSGPNIGLTKYTLTCTSKEILDSTGTPTTLSSVISTTTSLEDWATFQQCGYARFNGTFKIKAVEDIDANTIALYVQNDGVEDTDYDEVDVGGQAGIFTDQVNLASTSYFIPDDEFRSDLFADDALYTVKSTTSSIVVIDNVIEPLDIPAGLRVFGRRTSGLLTLRDISGTASVLNFVSGDTATHSAYDRKFSVNLVNTQSDISVSITGDGITATVTLLSGDTDFLAEGCRILLGHSGVYTGNHIVQSIENATQFTISSTETDSVSGGILVGKTLCIDEEIEWYDDASDSILVSIDERWIPIEAPDDNYSLTPDYYTYHFDSNSYTTQPFLRSTMVSDNMYLTNGDDIVHKYDGTNIYRAGLPRWQPGLFTSIKPGTGILVPIRTADFNNVHGSTYDMTDPGHLEIGDVVVDSRDNEVYTVTRVNYDTASNEVIVDREIATTAGTGTLTVKSATYRYYFRLNMVDANNNIIASAATGSDDFVVEVSETSEVELKLVGLPYLGNYDYDRLEVEIYRTTRNTIAPYYKLVTLPLSYDAEEGYVQYTDTTEDSVLTQLDVVNSALLGSELGNRWQEPLRAKYVTSAGNRLLLANLTDYPESDITLYGNGVTNVNLNGLKFQFDRTATIGSITDNLDTQIYEFRNTGDEATTVTRDSDSQFTVTVADNTGAAAGDWVYLFYKGTAPTDLNLETAGWWQITGTSGVTGLTIAHPNLSISSGTVPNRILRATDSENIPVYLNDSTVANSDSNYQTKYAQPISTVDEKNVAMYRLANAINVVNRRCRTTGFSPWLTAYADGSYGDGQIIVRQPKIEDRSFSFTAPDVSAISEFDLYINGLKINTSLGYANTAQTKVFPSRVIMSYPNYPEMFDNPTSILPEDSDSVFDINSADGQQITGMIPFFGDSAFGTGQKEDMVVVFKTNSIYLISLNTKAAGNSNAAVQKLESHGLGCTAPYSIAYTSNGINFANESGIYRLNRRDMSIDYVGQYMERNWLEKVDRSQLEIMQGHHYAIGKSYKLSVPTNKELDYPNEVYVYHHTSEDQPGGLGGWTRYDSHNAIGWANLGSNAYFCDIAGRVFSVRTTGDETDFRDGASAINAQITTRALDFGAPGIRKLFASILAHYRSTANVEGTQLTYSYDLQEEFRETDPIVVRRRESDNGVTDVINQKGKTIRSVLDRKRAVYFQVQFTNANIDEPLDVAGFTVKIAGLSDRGILEAKVTSDNG